MHGLIRDRLEAYLGGGPGKVPPEFEDHLQRCRECREEVSWMQDQSQLLHALTAPAAVDPAAGFYARVLERIEQQQVPSIWSVFLEPAFARRVLATSLALATILAGYLAYSESRGNVLPADAETLISDQSHPPGLGQNRDQDRETILVTLATYRE